MNTKRYLTIFILVLGILLTLSVGLSGAQEAQDNPPPADPASVSAPVSPMIPIQGRLTNANGSPLNGDYKLTLRVYDVQRGGRPLCADSQLVSVKSGLFNTAIEGCTTTEINGQQLYLGVEVEQDGEMTPRQRFYPAPYAYSLVPGASMLGSLARQPMFLVANKEGPALKVEGELQVDGILKSSKHTYLFIPGSAIVKNSWFEYQNEELYITLEQGAAKISWHGMPLVVDKWVSLPITIPGMIYGQPVRIIRVRIFYDCETTAAYIAETHLTRQTGAASSWNLVNDATIRSSTVPTFYDPPIDPSYSTLSSSSGPLTLTWKLHFGQSGSYHPYIKIGMVRLTLEHD